MLIRLVSSCVIWLTGIPHKSSNREKPEGLLFRVQRGMKHGFTPRSLKSIKFTCSADLYHSWVVSGLSLVVCLICSHQYFVIWYLQKCFMHLLTVLFFFFFFKYGCIFYVYFMLNLLLFQINFLLFHYSLFHSCPWEGNNGKVLQETFPACVCESRLGWYVFLNVPKKM